MSKKQAKKQAKRAKRICASDTTMLTPNKRMRSSTGRLLNITNLHNTDKKENKKRDIVKDNVLLCEYKKPKFGVQVKQKRFKPYDLK